MARVDVYLAVGHGLKPDGAFDPGVVGPDGFQEHAKAHEVVSCAARALERSGVSFLSEHHAGASHDPNHVGSARDANASGAKLAVEVHFNSSPAGAPPGSGTEVFAHPTSSSGQRFAARCSELIAGSLGLRNRGAKKANFAFLKNTRMTASLVEVCFVNNPVDRSKFRATPAGEALAQAICEHLSKTFVPAPSV